ncbi:MAG: SGNH/GDSL hydrolase family protein [Colwelliaceae bacterium]|nr:SGNH/GDSL hydrolase family protein [Colwelliaceae bacterium]
MLVREIYHNLLTFFLIPLLLIQAIWTRKNIVRLSEPKGSRTGTLGAGNQLKLLIIGDSSAAGVGVNKQEKALAGQLSLSLSSHLSVNWQLIAKNGFTSTNILNELEKLPIQDFDFILVSVGVNDVTHLTRSRHWINNLEQMISLINSKFSAPKIIFSSLPPMHLFSGIPQPLRWCLGERAKKLNTLMSIVARNNNCSILAVEIPFSDKYLADDNFHPSHHAYQLWADQAEQLIIQSIKDTDN